MMIILTYAGWKVIRQILNLKINAMTSIILVVSAAALLIALYYFGIVIPVANEQSTFSHSCYTEGDQFRNEFFHYPSEGAEDERELE